jgi:hypothetical protein
VYTTHFIECRGIYNTSLNTNLHFFSHEELRSQVLYIAIFYVLLSGVNVYTLLLKEMLYLLPFMCWTCTITFNSASPLPLLLSFYILVNNRDKYKPVSEIHSINTRQNSSVYQPLSNLTTYQKGTYYYGIKVFNNLPSDINRMSHYVTQFRLALHDFLRVTSMCGNSSHNTTTYVFYLIYQIHVSAIVNPAVIRLDTIVRDTINTIQYNMIQYNLQCQCK